MKFDKDVAKANVKNSLLARGKAGRPLPPASGTVMSGSNESIRLRPHRFREHKLPANPRNFLGVYVCFRCLSPTAPYRNTPVDR